MVNIARYIDHTILKPETTEGEIIKYCQEAKKYGFCSVCVNSAYVQLVSRELKGEDVKVTVVVGFPLGACTTETKVCEAKSSISKGADEIDMVINIGALKGNKNDYVLEDIKAVVSAVSEKVVVKVIIETALLTEKEKGIACELAKKAGADFVKTSTGFSMGGATIEDVKLMRRIVGNEMGVKASGGIRDYQTAMMMIEAGASRLGCSASVNIIRGKKS